MHAYVSVKNSSFYVMKQPSFIEYASIGIA